MTKSAQPQRWQHTHTPFVSHLTRHARTHSLIRVKSHMKIFRFQMHNYITLTHARRHRRSAHTATTTTTAHASSIIVSSSSARVRARRTRAPRRTRRASLDARRPRPQSPIVAKGHARACDACGDAHRALTYLCVRVRERSRERDATMACACAGDAYEDDEDDDVDDVTDDRGPGTPTGEWVL